MRKKSWRGKRNEGNGQRTIFKALKKKGKETKGKERKEKTFNTNYIQGSPSKSGAFDVVGT